MRARGTNLGCGRVQIAATSQSAGQFVFPFGVAASHGCDVFDRDFVGCEVAIGHLVEVGQ